MCTKNPSNQRTIEVYHFLLQGVRERVLSCPLKPCKGQSSGNRMYLPGSTSFCTGKACWQVLGGRGPARSGLLGFEMWPHPLPSLSCQWPGLTKQWRKEMATHSSILAWRIPGTEEPSGLPSMGSHRVRHD